MLEVKVSPGRKSEEALEGMVNAIATGAYRVGGFTLRNGRRALIVAKGTRVLYLEMANVSLLLAPDDFDGFAEAVKERLSAIEKRVTLD